MGIITQYDLIIFTNNYMDVELVDRNKYVTKLQSCNSLVLQCPPSVKQNVLNPANSN